MVTGPLITGQSPKLQWNANPDGRRRTLEEAISLAKSYDVIIGDDIEFFVDDENSAFERESARPGHNGTWR